MPQKEREERKNDISGRNRETFEELTKDIQMTEGEIFLSVDFTRGGEEEDDE